VFVPRPRSELLVAEARSAAPARAVVADLCCGSGAISAFLHDRVPGARIHAADLDPIAVACARENLAGIGSIHPGDLYDALPGSLRGRVDLIVANAPYVPSAELATLPRDARDHEPRAALDGGCDGLDVHRRLAAGAWEWLAPSGTQLLEVAHGQVPAAVAAVTDAGMAPRVVRSEGLDVAVVAGSRSGPSGPSREASSSA
jgi:release factor glutamine methyltransferase